MEVGRGSGHMPFEGGDAIPAFFAARGSLFHYRSNPRGRLSVLEQLDWGMVYPVRTRKSPETVVFTYLPAKDPKDVKAKIDGDAIAVELVSKDFQLKP